MIDLTEEGLSRDVQFENMVNALRSSKPESENRKSSLKSSRMISIINSYNFTNAYKKDNKVIFVGEQFPSELLVALNIVPFNLESMAGVLAKTDQLASFLKLSDQNYLSRDVCSVLRGEFGLGLANCFPTPDLMISSNQTCDGFMKIAHNLGQLYKKKICAIDTHNTYNEDVIAYVGEQLRAIVLEIEKELDVKMEEEILREVISSSNEAKTYYKKTLELCQNVSIQDVSHELMMIAMISLWGMKEMKTACKTLYEEALEISCRLEGNKPKKRVVWHGQTSFLSDEIIEYIEKRAEIIYFGAFLTYPNLLDPDDPYRSFARRLLYYSWNPFVMGQVIKDHVDPYKLNGIILQNSWGCRNILGINSILRENAKEKKLKILMLDNDFLDREKIAFSHVKNRIDAFLEIL